MNNNDSHLDFLASEIEGNGYMIESKSASITAGDLYRVSFYDKKHTAVYNFVEDIKENGESFIKINAALLSGIEDDFTRTFEGELGVFSINNFGKQKECSIEYKIKPRKNTGVTPKLVGDALMEVENSIYRVRYRKSFAL